MKPELVYTKLTKKKQPTRPDCARCRSLMLELAHLKATVFREPIEDIYRNMVSECSEDDFEEEDDDYEGDWL